MTANNRTSPLADTNDRYFPQLALDLVGDFYPRKGAKRRRRTVAHRNDFRKITRHTYSYL